MYIILLTLHSLLRWFVVIGLPLALGRATWGLIRNAAWTATDNRIRVAVVTLTHVQFVLGLVLYGISPVTHAFMDSPASMGTPGWFFGIIHIGLMTTAVGVLTVGTSLAKRATTDRRRFACMATYGGLALVLILLAIPWPFSPLAARPYLRPF